MSPTLQRLGIDKMTVEERMQLIDEIWVTIPPDFVVPEWHRRLIDERIAYADAHPEDRIPWEKALEDLRNDR